MKKDSSETYKNIKLSCTIRDSIKLLCASPSTLLLACLCFTSRRVKGNPSGLGIKELLLLSGWGAKGGNV